MSRAPSTNGHSVESVRAKGGYDAFFAQATEQDAPPAANGPGTAGVPAQPYPGASEPVIGAPDQPHRQAAPGQDGPGAPQRAQGPDISGPNTQAQSNQSQGAPAQSNQSQNVPAWDAAGRSAPYNVQTQTQSAQTQSAQTQSAQTQSAQTQSAQTQGTQVAHIAGGQQSSSAEPSRPDSEAAANAASVARESWTAHSEPAATSAPTTQHDVWPSAGATSNWVPERIDRSAIESPRIEVLPAALTPMDLLSDIEAANRAKLQSSSGVRGALNKVGFKLGLSPAEQRTEDRRTRIRRQLNTTYQIAVISVKGGVGRTTTAATLGSTFAALRPDRVVAVDANPDFGDLPTRTSPHPYGLTLRDLSQATNLEAFSSVQSFMSINSADLATIASPWTIESNEALSGREYATAVEVLRRHFNLLVVDCGTGVLDSVTYSVLQTSDAVVVVTPATVGGVKGAVATLNWLGSHGMQHLIAKSVVSIVHHQPSKPVVDVEAIEKLFATGQRPTCILPYDIHLAEGGEIDLRLLDKDTLLAFEELAAGLADGFPNYMAGGAGGSRAAGGWR